MNEEYLWKNLHRCPIVLGDSINGISPINGISTGGQCLDNGVKTPRGVAGAPVAPVGGCAPCFGTLHRWESTFIVSVPRSWVHRLLFSKTSSSEKYPHLKFSDRWIIIRFVYIYHWIAIVIGNKNNDNFILYIVRTQKNAIFVPEKLKLKLNFWCSNNKKYCIETSYCILI